MISNTPLANVATNKMLAGRYEIIRDVLSTGNMRPMMLNVVTTPTSTTMIAMILRDIVSLCFGIQPLSSGSFLFTDIPGEKL
jgi:hypothetical protein